MPHTHLSAGADKVGTFETAIKWTHSQPTREAETETKSILYNKMDNDNMATGRIVLG
jgi:hypothetical protein